MMIDSDGLHLLSSRYSAGRFQRHLALKDIVKRVLDATGTHSVLEPVGLDRGDGRRPDGITVFPFLQGNSLMWDATCYDILAPSLITTSSAFSGPAATAVEYSRRLKYASLASGYHFVPFSVKISGVIGTPGIA